jgi:hypothetical protein
MSSRRTAQVREGGRLRIYEVDFHFCRRYERPQVYELDSAGKATARFETAGDVFKWVRVR